MTISEERVLKGMYLRDWQQQDDDVKRIIANVCSVNGVMNYGELAEHHPETFDELYEVVEGLLEESPVMGHLPGYMQ